MIPAPDCFSGQACRVTEADMPFIPHTPQEVEEMLSAIGVNSTEELFDEIPASLRCGDLENIPPRMTEMEVTRLMQSRASKDAALLNFIGAGAYEHHIPAAVWQIVTRGEYYTAYTPYQAEASQGTLQLIYEYQTMMTGLTGLDVSNASLYDGASALGEAVLMAVRINRKSKSKKVLMPASIHPTYRATADGIVKNQGIELVELPWDQATGMIDTEALAAFAGEDITAVIIPQPNFFGVLEDVDALTDWAHDNGAVAVGLVNPVSLALLKPPGEWGSKGVDLACGDGQPLGAPLSSGGPYYGFMCCRTEHVRQMPGRIVGRTTDADGKLGFVLTLQAREQHIRRSRATSNICTNQGLVVAASTVHMALLGPQGLKKVAAHCHANTQKLTAGLQAMGLETMFNSHTFHEVVIKLGQPATEVIESMTAHGVLAGYALGQDYDGMDDALLVCVTEMRTDEDIQLYLDALAAVLNG